MLYTDSWLELAKVSLPNIVRYCIKHDYRWNIQRIKEPYDAFDKIRNIQKIFSDNSAHVVMSMDCDSIITNYNIKVESFLDDENDFYITKDCNAINAGVFIVKNTEWGNNFVNKVYDYEERYRQSGCEQNAIERYIGIFGEDKIKYLSYPSINSYPLNEYYPSYGRWGYKEGDVIEKPDNEWHEGDFILHAPGLPLEKRLSILKNTPIIR